MEYPEQLNLNDNMDKNMNYKSICCENIPELFLDKLIAKKHFNKFGKINRFIFCPKRLSCTVEYENEDDAKNAYENANNYNGYYFDISYATNEVARAQNTEEWVDPEVQAELDAMGLGSTFRNPSRVQQQQQQRAKLPALTRISKSITKPSIRTLPLFSTTTTTAAVPSILSEIPPKVDITVKQELEMILKKQALNAEDKFKILDARDKLIRLTSIRTTDIKKAKSTKGTCPDMCPEKERLLREAKHQVSSFEMDIGKNIMNHKIAIKEYSRSSADQEAPLAHELRPEPILKMTMIYLMHNIMDVCDDPNINLGDWYHFVWDRTRSIRKDITQQELCSLESVRLVEQCARFHIHCAARLIAEDPSVFDQKINTENLTKCLQTLKYMYHDLRLKNIKCPNEQEFRAYIILLNLNDGNFLWELKHLPDEIQNSKEVREALSFYLAIDSNNYVKFFRLMRQTTYMNACILLRYFNQVRNMAIRIIMKAYCSPRFYSISLDYLKNILAFESKDETISFLRHYSLECDNGKVILDKNSFYEPETSYIMDRSYTVESKRQTTVGEAICGQKLDSSKIFENYIPHSSFDEYGYLKEEAWTAEDQLSEQYSKKVRNNCDRNLFKIPRPSPPISPKQQQFKITQFETKFNQDVVTKPLTFSITSTTTTSATYSTPTEFFFSKKNSTDSSESLFNIKNSITSQSVNNDNQSSIFPSSKSKNFPMKLSTLEGSSSSSSIGLFTGTSFQAFTKSEPTSFTTNIFGLHKSVEDNNLFNVQNSSVKSISNENDDKILFKIPKVSNLNSKQSTDEYKEFEKPKINVNYEQTQKLKIEKSNEKTITKLNDSEIDLIEQEKQEKERIQKEKENREKKLKEIETNSENIYEDLLKNIFLIEIQEIASEELINYEKLLKLAKNYGEKILEEEIYEIIHEIINEEIQKLRKCEEIARKYFILWKDKMKKRIERQKLIESTPMWITEESITEQASNYNHIYLNETLSMMKRYRLGIPTQFNLIKKSNETINLFKLVSKEFENKIIKNDIGLLKRKIYFKCILSLPEEPKNYQEHENSKGFYEYMNHCLKKLLVSNENENINKEFLCKCQENICLCLRKVHGINPKNENNEEITNECNNSDAILFIMTCSNIQNSQKRLQALINLSSNRKIPFAIIIYNSKLNKKEIEEKLNLKNLIDNDLILNYKIYEIYEKENRSNMKEILKESFKYLINTSYEQYNNNNLEMQDLSSFLFMTLGDEFWNRLNNTLLINPSFNKFCTIPNNVIELYNEAINRLLEIINENFENYPEFPEELKKFINEPLSYNIPLDIEYFPNNWKNLQSVEKLKIYNFLMKIKLPKTMFNINNDNNNIPNDLNEYENLILNYTEKCIPFDKNYASKLAYNAIKTFLNKLENCNFQEILWLDIIKNIALGLMIFQWNIDNKNLPTYIIYNKKSINDYIKIPWWLKMESLKKIKMLPIESLSTSSSSLSLQKENYNIKNNEIDYNDDIDNYDNDDDDDDDDENDHIPKAKRMKNNLSSINNNELDKLLEKGYAMIQKADKNIEKFKKFSTIRRNISKDLDKEFYRQERINQSIKRFLYENKYN